MTVLAHGGTCGPFVVTMTLSSRVKSKHTSGETKLDKPTPNRNSQNLTESPEQSSSPAYVPYPREGIQDKHSSLQPTVGQPKW